jgi:dihydropteroate synthase
MTERPEYSVRFADGGSLELGRQTCVMGVLNVTPDSFSDGGRHATPSRALEAAAAMARAGAGLIDVGGESTRPGADPVSPGEETDRVLPVIEAIRREFEVRISIDTMKAEVARRALAAGADLVNDVSAMGDPEMLPLLVATGAPIILMHMRGRPRTMQPETDYGNVVGEVADFLRQRAESAVNAGVAGDRILLDPGIGFGKSADGSLALLRGLPVLGQLGRPLVIGASRKSFIGATLGLPAGERLEASLALAVFAGVQGAHVVRVHDVEATVRAVRMIDAIRQT